MKLTRAAALGLAALAGYATVVMTVPGQASAATAYRYWAYYVASASTAQTSSWQYSQRGPATEYPVDGEVQGWRFAVQADAANGPVPRAAPDFATLCGSTPAKAGDIRVGVVIDFGLVSDAPTHEKPPAGVVRGCVNVHDGATGADVIEAAVAVRIGTGSDAGLVCGIDGYPKTECAVAVAAPAAPPPAPPSPTPSTASPKATASTHQPATTPDSSPLASPTAVTPAPISSSVTSATSSAVPSSGPAPAATQTSLPVAASASPVSLATLRSNARHSNRVPATTIAGVALLAILGGAAIWRTRARGR